MDRRLLKKVRLLRIAEAMMKSRLGKPVLEELPAIWRVFVGVIVFGLLGCAIGLAWEFYPDHARRGFLGAFIALPVGFCAGLGWHLSAHEGRFDRGKWLIFALGLFYVALAGIAVFWHLPAMRAEVRRLGELKALDPSAIRCIVVLDGYGEEKLKTISERQVLESFCGCVQDAKGRSSTSANYSTARYLVIYEAKSTIELQCHYSSVFPGKLVCNFVRKDGSTIFYYGAFLSSALREWFLDNAER